jgi:hypothetical protein
MQNAAMVRALLATATSLAVLLVVASGCGAADDDTPVACLDGPGAYIGALGNAPGEVRLSGEVPISDCLVVNQGGGELATVGISMVGAATQLNDEARTNPGDAANLQLGYLLGAAEQGAEGTNGIHVELIRRLRAAALYSPDGRPLPPKFLRVYRRGLDAGRTTG